MRDAVRDSHNWRSETATTETKTMSETIAKRQKFWFVVGEIVCGQMAHNVFDAWFKVEAGKGKYGSEFTQDENRTIEAYTVDGEMIARRTWSEWHAALMADTYGYDWKESIQRAEALAR